MTDAAESTIRIVRVASSSRRCGRRVPPIARRHSRQRHREAACPRARAAEEARLLAVFKELASRLAARSIVFRRRA